MNPLDAFLARLAHEPACLVTVLSTRGSVPRERGAWMAVFDDETIGTVGGGQLEFQAIAQARGQLRDASWLPGMPVRFALGPNLGQCCGGEVHLVFEVVHAPQIAEIKVRLKELLSPVALPT